jgi:peptidyl-prolyl cis-trans isomerase A (cyclophilin A)
MIPSRRFEMTRALLVVLLAGAFVAFSGATASAANPKVLMKTSKGDITIELYQDKAPITVRNFLSYVDAKFYDGTVFHRVIKNFMIQGGGMTADLQEKPTGPPIKNEAANGLKNERGTIAMARTSVIDSATSQFFINHKDNLFLDHKDNSAEGFGYCVFGKVITGMDVVDAIANSPTTTAQGMGDVPRQTITILSVQKTS